MGMRLGVIASGRRGDAVAPPDDEFVNRTPLTTVAWLSFTTQNTRSYSEIIGSPKLLRTANEDRCHVRLNKAATLRNLRVFVATNTRTSGSTILLRVNRQDTQISINIPRGATGWFYSTEEFEAQPGDVACYAIDTGPGSGTLDISMTVLEHEASDAPTCYFSVHGHDGLATGAYNQGAGPRYSAVHVTARNILLSWEAFEGKNTLRCTGGFSHARLNVIANSLARPFSVTLHKNGVATDLVITYAAGETGWKSKDDVSVTVAPGDEIGWVYTCPGWASGDGGVVFGHLEVMYTSADGTWPLLNAIEHQADAPSGAATRYAAPGSGALYTNTTADRRQLRLPFEIEVSDLTVDGYYNSGQPGFDAIFQVDGVDTLLKVTVPTGQSYTDTVSDPVNSAEVPAESLFNYIWTVASLCGPYHLSLEAVSKGSLPEPAELPLGATTLSYTGSFVEYVVPAGVKQVQFKMWGAGGGGGYWSGGSGGYTRGAVDVEEGDVIRLAVGQGGRSVLNESSGDSFPDGGGATSTDTNQHASSGGGSSRIYVNGVLQALAAGGGGNCYTTVTTATAGGGYSSSSTATGADPATQFSGWNRLRGAPSLVANNGGGGGGWWGGWSSTTSSRPATGGSSYTNGPEAGFVETFSGAWNSSSGEENRPLPSGTADANYPGGDVGKGGAGNSSIGVVAGTGGNGAIWLNTLAEGDVVLGEARLFQQHAEVIHAGAAQLRLYQQHVEVIRSIS